MASPEGISKNRLSEPCCADSRYFPFGLSRKRQNSMRWGIIFGAALILLIVPFLSGARAADVIAVRSQKSKFYDQAIDGFKSTCGCSVQVVDYSAGVPEMLRRDPPLAVLAVGSRAFRLLKNEMKELPLYYIMVLPSELVDPVRNSTGVAAAVAPRIWIDTLLDSLEEVRKIGILYSEKNSGSYARDIDEQARRKGIKAILKEAHSPKEVPLLIERFHDIDAFLLLPDAFVANTEAVNYIMLHCYQNKIPIVSFTKRHLELGALLSLDIEVPEMGKQAGELAKASMRQGFYRTGKREYARRAAVSVNFEVAEKLKVRMRQSVKKRGKVKGPTR